MNPSDILTQVLEENSDTFVLSMIFNGVEIYGIPVRYARVPGFSIEYQIQIIVNWTVENMFVVSNAQ